jgi:Clp amino terminal domain, pathogenicity island component/ClpX C4-type zinc finger
VFERFTDRARRVVVLAQEESRLLGHNYIGTEHLLLGLLHEGEGIAARALVSLNVSLADGRSEVERIIGHSDSAPVGHIPFTPRAKKVLEMGLREALLLEHNYIGTEHILLGLIREREGVAAQVLGDLGADLDTVRQRVVQLLAGHPGGTEAGLFREGRGTRVVRSSTPTAARIPQCSFCRRPLREVDRYAPGKNAAICDECITAAHTALRAAGDERIVMLPARVTGTPPPDEPDAAEKIVAAIRASPHDPPGEERRHLRIVEIRFITPALAEVRFSRFSGAVDLGDDPLVGTAVRDGGRWNVNLGFGFAPEA